MIPSTTTRLLWTVVVAGVVALAVGAATFSAFSSTTANTGSGFAVGTVALGDNDAGAAMLDLQSAAPGDSATSCINVTYTGTLDARVRLYGSVSGALAPYLDLTVTRGTDPSPSFPSCAGFTPDGTDYVGAGPGVVYAGTLDAYPGGYASGLVDPVPGAPATWSTGTEASYRFTVSLQDDLGARGKSATATFTWEARNA